MVDVGKGGGRAPPRPHHQPEGMYAREWPLPLYVLCVPWFACFSALPSPELEFLELLRSPGIDSQPGEPVWKHYLMNRPAWLQSSRNRSLESNPGLLKRLQIRAQIHHIVFHLVVSIVRCLFEGKVSLFFLLFTSQQNRIRILPTNDIPIAL
jgi:hypothetical protein